MYNEWASPLAGLNVDDGVQHVVDGRDLRASDQIYAVLCATHLIILPRTTSSRACIMERMQGECGH